MTADLDPLTNPPNKSTHCLFCNSKLGVSSRNSCDIFSNKNLLGNEDRALSTLIGEVLQIEATKESIHSNIICKKCFKLLYELDEIETRMTELKMELTTNYNKTLKLITEGPPETPEEEEGKLPMGPEGEVVVKKRGRKKGQVYKKTKPSSSQESEEEYETKENDMDEEDEEILMDHDDSEYIPEGYHRITSKMRIKSEPLDDDDEDEFDEDGRRGRRKMIKEEIPSDLPEKWVERTENDYLCLLCPEPNPEEESTTITITPDNPEPTIEQTQKNVFDIKTITNHMKTAHELRIYICDICGEDFRKRTQLSLHLDDHVANEEGDFQCEICNRIFTNLRLFRIHKRMHYPPSKLWSCETCGKRYNSRNLLDEHINTHTGTRPYVCKTCGKDFASKYTFKAHCKTHEVRPRPFICNLCGKSFLSAQNLNQHERTHSGLRNFVCDQCGKAFGTARNLEVHSVVHSGHKPYICRMCGKAFARKAEIRDHERTHTGEKPYQCEFCGATFSQRSNLQSHKRATHYQDKRYKCDDCGKGFKRRRLLDYHIKAVHTGERPFKCNVCGATFVYPEHFKKHRRIHTGEKPFHCEVCGKAFNSRDNRNAHRFVHSDKKPYECLVCGMGFMRKPLLYNHMQTQGHLNDTIVVNQPRLATEEDLMGEAEVVEMVTANTGEVEMIVDDPIAHEEETKLYIAGLKEPVIIRPSEDLKHNDQELVQEAVEHLIIDGQVHFADANDISSLHEEIEPVTEEYDEENSRHALIVPATRNILGQEIVELEDNTEDGTTIETDHGQEITALDANSSEVHTEDGAVHLVHIRIPGPGHDDGHERTWFIDS